jgi:hypothetical protein
VAADVRSRYVPYLTYLSSLSLLLFLQSLPPLTLSPSPPSHTRIFSTDLFTDSYLSTPP